MSDQASRTAKITRISDGDKTITTKDGTILSIIEGDFADGSLWSHYCPQSKAQQAKSDLQALVGVEGLFVLVSQGEYQGKKKWKVSAWPGRPQRAPYQGGGRHGSSEGSGFIPRYRDSLDGFNDEGARIARSVALQQAVAFCDEQDAILPLADKFYDWLIQALPARPVPPIIQDLQQMIPGIHTGADMKGTAQKAADTIAKAAGEANATLLNKCRAGVAERYDEKAISPEERDDLEIALLVAELTIAKQTEIEASGKTCREIYASLLAKSVAEQRKLHPDVQEALDRF